MAKRIKKDRKYNDWIHRQPCAITDATWDVVGHHEPPKGMGGGRSTDRDLVPLVLRLHLVRHGQALATVDDARAVGVEPVGEWRAEVVRVIERRCLDARAGLRARYEAQGGRFA